MGTKPVLKIKSFVFLTILVPWQWNKKCKGWILHHTKLQNLLRPASLPYFYHGFPEWLQTRRPRGPFTVTQAMLSSLIITLYALRFIFFYFFVYLVRSINKLEFACLLICLVSLPKTQGHNCTCPVDLVREPDFSFSLKHNDKLNPKH